MHIYVLFCLVVSTIFCFSEENIENLDAMKNGIELGQKILDEKVERYNELLKKHHQKKQKGLQEKKNTQALVGSKRTRGGERVDDGSTGNAANAKVKDGSAVVEKEGDSSGDKAGSQIVEESADERELRRLSLEIEKEQDVLDRRVERYNQKLQKKSDQEAEDKAHDDLVEPLREEIRRLTNLVEHLQKDMKEFKQSAISGVKGIVTPEKKKIQDAFELALIALKEDVRAGITKLVQFLTDHPEDELAIEAHLKLGDAYNKIGRWDKAYAAFDTIKGFDQVIIPQIIEAKLGMAEAQIGKNNREAACMTLIKLEKSNNPMSDAQLNRYQRMLVDYHCSSKMDRDERKKQETKKTFSLLDNADKKK